VSDSWKNLGARQGFRKEIRRVMTQEIFDQKQQWRQIECRGNFPCEVWGISFANRVFTKKTRVCLPLLLLQ